MKRSISIAVIFLLYISWAAAQTLQGDWTELGLKGKVESMQEYTYSVLEKAGEVQKGEKIKSRYYFLDDKGMLIEENRKWQKGIYPFDNDNMRRIRIEEEEDWYRLNWYKSDGNFIKKKYDDKDNEIEENWYSWNGISRKYTWKYNSKGDVIEKKEYKQGEEGNLTCKSTSKYDDKGNIIEWNEYDQEDEKINRKFTWKYDDNRKIIEHNSYNRDGGLADKTIYMYDSNGNMIELHSHNSYGDEKTTYKYGYDKNLNWIKKIEFRDTLPISTTERVIEYY